MTHPELQLKATHYLPDQELQPIEPEVSDQERHAMEAALDWARFAMSEGNPPIGASIISHETELVLSMPTSDKAEKNLMRHAEIRVLNEAQPLLGDDLKKATLVTNAQPCTSCTPYYTAGKIGKIVSGARRDMVRAVSGIMRERQINMAELLEDGNTDTIVVENFMAVESLKLFVEYGRLNNYELPDDIPPYLRELATEI